VPGKNVVQIAVTNNWWNRLVGDEKLLPERRKPYTSAKSVAPRRDLLPSGLLGPVQIVPMQLCLLDDGKR